MEQAAFDRILSSLHDAALDDDLWPATSALIDEACGSKGNVVTFAEGRSPSDVKIFMAWICYRGERHRVLERSYFGAYYPRDERIPRLIRLADSRLVRIADLYTPQEMKSSAAYNEVLSEGQSQNGLNARLTGPKGSRIVWSTADPVDPDGWSSDQIDLIRAFLPHLRQYVRVRQTLLDASALGASLVELLENTASGIVQLDRRGRIVAANDCATSLLRRGDALSDRRRQLSARRAADDARLKGLLARALPRFGEQGSSGSMVVSRPNGLPGLTVHVSPVGQEQRDSLPWRVAALAIVTDHRRTRVSSALVQATLGLTPTESLVAALLAEGQSVRDIATMTGRKERTVRWHVEQIFEKRGISRQVDLVREVLSLAEPPADGRDDRRPAGQRS